MRSGVLQAVTIIKGQSNLRVAYFVVGNVPFALLPGPLYNYDLPMNIFRSDTLMNSNLNVRMSGNPTLEPGKIGNAINLDGRRDYLDAGDQSDTCLGDTSLCVYGIMVSSWIKFNELADNMYLFSSGNKGFKLYYDDGRLVGEVQRGNDNWKTDWSGAQTGRWYFVELAWDPANGIRLFVDQQEVAKSTEKRAKEPREGTSQLYIGRANTQMVRERYANALFDEVQFSYGDRERLEKFGFIARGESVLFGRMTRLRTLSLSSSLSLSLLLLLLLWFCSRRLGHRLMRFDFVLS